MGWGTSLYSEIYFDRLTLDTKNKVEECLEKVQGDLLYCRTRIKNLVLMTEPNKFFTDPTQDLIITLNNEVDDLLEWYDDLVILESKLQQLLFEWDELVDENGKIKIHNVVVDENEPSDHYIKPILIGDFINLKYENGELVKK